MIIDKLENLADYRSLGKSFAQVCELLGDLDIAALPDGKNEIDGKGVFANVSHSYPDCWEGKLFEAHREYVDIQCVLSGCEVMGYAELTQLEEQQEYSEAQDIAFYNDPLGIASKLIVGAGMFVVFFPEDAHKPSCRYDDGLVHKVVLKVRL